MDQGCWTTAHVNAFRYFGGAAKIIQCDNLKTGVDKHSRNEIKLNRAYSELAEHYNTAILPCRVRSPKDKASVQLQRPRVFNLGAIFNGWKPSTRQIIPRPGNSNGLHRAD